MDATASREPLFPRAAAVALAVAALALALLMPIPAAKASGALSSRISISGDGFEASLKRLGYRLEVEIEGAATFAADESDLATLAPGGEFELEEKVAGTLHRYTVEADRDGALTRAYFRDGKPLPLDAEALAWRKAALQRAFRGTGLDAEARVARLLARGPAALLDEIAELESDWVRAHYLQAAFASPALDDAAALRAFELAGAIGSDFELRRALSAAIPPSSALPAVRAEALLAAAGAIGSDFERATLLVDAAPRLPGTPAVIANWRAAVSGVQSDFEMRRALIAALEAAPAGFRLAVLEAAAGIQSDFELRTVLTAAAPLLAKDAALVGRYLDRVERMGSDFEQRVALVEIAGQVGGTPAKDRYVAIAKSMGEFERNQALAVLLEGDAL